MKIQILFYTFGGATRKEAFRLAGELIEKPLAKIAADSEEKFVTKFVDVYDDTIIFS